MINSFQSAIGRIREQARKRSDYQTLMMQEDRFFQDIGLSRSDAYDAIYNGRRRD
jgi:uncharacterized protein YjiS (DUF1127 family)